MSHSPKDALIAAKEDLLAAYSAVHTSLGRLINLAHHSEPRVIADVLASEYTPHPQSAPQNHHPSGLSGHGHRYSQAVEHSKCPNTAPPYPAPPQPPSSTHPRINAPPGPSFMTVTPGAPRQPNYAPAHSQKARQRKPQPLPPSHSYASQPAQHLETDDDEDDDPEEAISEEDHHPNGSTSAYYLPPSQMKADPTPPGSIPGGKKKKVKRERDPNAPKRPASAYILFQNAVRNEMRAANPTADHKELARQIGDRWKNLSEDDKRPWSEAGKLAMSSWNIQNKEYKISHPEVTSPHNQVNGNPIPAPPMKASRGVKVDEFGNCLPKKRGRPSKLEKDPAGEQQLPSGELGGLHRVQSNHEMSIDPANIHNGAPAHQFSAPGQHGQAKHGAVSQLHGVEYSEEDEAEEEDEEEEEVNPHAQVPPTSFQQTNRTSQISSHVAPTDSDMDEGDDDEGSAASTTEHVSHTNSKMGVHSNGILA